MLVSNLKRREGRWAAWAMTAVLAMIAPGRAAETTDGKVWTQKPEIVASQARGGETVAATPQPAANPSDGRGALKAGPTPTWIWGANEGQKYVLRTEFSGGSKAAWLKASCDNVMTLYVNGQRVAASDAWETPVEIDVQKHVKPGMNVLAAEVENQAGPAGFVAKLALIDEGGAARYVVSDGSWKAGASADDAKAAPAREIVKLGGAPWMDVFSGVVLAGGGGPRDLFNTLPGFRVERLYTVPKNVQGSWVALTFDPQGRAVASDQGGQGLYRITVPALGSEQPTKVEKLDVTMSGAQGLLFAFGSLYVSANGGPGSGLWRLRDTNNDDQFDEVVKLKDFAGGGEHGPHSLRLTPDGKSLIVSCGNHTQPPAQFQHSRVPKNWGEDLLLPRQWDANGHARGVLAPGGWVARTDPDGKEWEIMTSGYRNQYDMAYNADGELFVYDADMEWDMGMPWYRPTRVSHSPSGSEFGWRSGTGKWPGYYVDSLPAAVDIGPGSPVGVTFGYGTKFPAKYQKALFILDWTFGTIYAVHLTPEGASYRATKEQFVSRTPLPLTDAAVGPDGALYFTIGGRGTQSELFRVVYTGSEPTAPVDAKDTQFAAERALRQKIEAYHAPAADAAAAVAFVYPHLSHADRHIRYAARIALEHQPVAAWQDRVLAEKDPVALIQGAVALARQGAAEVREKLIAALEKVDFKGLALDGQLDLLRAWQLVFVRLGEPDEATAVRVAKLLDAFYPAQDERLNRELCILLVYLQSPTAASKTIALMKQPPSEKTPEQIGDILSRNPGYGGTIAGLLANQVDLPKMDLAFALRNLRKGWKIDERLYYFQFLTEARTKSGGASFQGFINNIDKDAFENSTDSERLAVEAAKLRKPYVPPALPQPRGPGKEWTIDEVLTLAQGKISGRNFAGGQRAYAAARCVLCHRFGGDGGATGPDLTQVAGRFTPKDLTESILDPSKVVSDQYQAKTVVTKSGKVHTGRIVSENAKALTVLINPEDSSKVVEVAKDDVDEIMPSKVSLMPKDLLKTLSQDEVLDLLAYLLSRGNPQDAMFQK